VNILGLDTATTGCSAAFWSAGGIVAHRFEEMERGQAERLNPMIGEVLADCGFAFGDIDAIAVTVGPGAFTGLRIGLAVARAIGLAVSAPVVGITTFAALARAVPEAEGVGRTLLVAINGKRKDVFAQIFDADWQPEGEPAALDPGTAFEALPAGPLLIAGDGGPALKAALADCAEAGEGAGARIRFSSAMGPPDAAHVAAAVAQSLAGQPLPAALPPRPLYIRPPDARLPDAGPRS
jgi:tRNA threonylcarbamoyladenosine biosynthesis protein TsaB